MSSQFRLSNETSATGNPFLEQPSILILPKDLINRIFTDIIGDADLYSFSLTCKTLSEMSRSPQILIRIRDFKIIRLFAMQLNGKSTQLIVALNDRSLSASESQALELSPVTFVDDNEKKLDASHRCGTEKCEGEFYDMFKMRCTQLSIYPDSSAFILYAMTVVENLKKKPLFLGISNESMRVKLESTKSHMHCKIFHDVVQTYASQPIAMITPKNFKEKVAELQPLFPTINIVHTESSLRNAIKAIVNSDEITSLADLYLGTDHDHPEVHAKDHKLGLFYKELNQYVFPGQEMIRSAALHAILLQDV